MRVARISLPVTSLKKRTLFHSEANLHTKFDKNRPKNRSAIVDKSLKMSRTAEVN